MKKRFATALVSLALILSTGTVVSAAPDPVKLSLNGNGLYSDVAPVIKDGRTLVPVRVISRSFGADVEWNSKEQQVILKKNNDVIKLKINDRQVLKNDLQAAPLDCPAQIVNGRTMVPVRFISETFGAKVDWENSSRTVKLVFEEKKDGMTALDLVQKSNIATQAQTSYKFDGTLQGTVKVSQPTVQNIKFTVNMQGAMQKVGDLQKMYLKESFTLPAELQIPASDTTIEIFLDGTNIYLKQNGGAWEKNPTPIDLSISKLQNPEQSMKLLQDLGILVVFGNDAEIDGKSYYNLTYSINNSSLKAIFEYVKKLTAQQVTDQAGLSADEEQKAMEEVQKLLETMVLNLDEKVYIDKSTYLPKDAGLDGQFTMNVEGINIEVAISGNVAFSGYGETVSLPTI